MGTKYHPFQIALTDGPKDSKRKGIAARNTASPHKPVITLRLKPDQIGRGDSFLLTTTQITHLRKAAAAKRGAELSISKAQSTKLAQKGGNLFSSLFSLAQPFVVPAAKAADKELGIAGISFVADKILKNIFGKGYGPSEVKLYHLERRLSPEQRRTIEKYLVGQGVVHGGGSAQYGGFLGMLASIGIPLAISLVKSVLGKGMQVGPSRLRRSAPLPPPPTQSGQGMQINPTWFQPPPVVGSWEKKRW